jgi:hypothetical protein
LKGATTEPCRDYFLDEYLPLPADIKIYYWLYPHRTQILVRDAAYLDLQIKDPVTMWFTKFFPLAFAIMWDPKNTHTLPVHELSLHRNHPPATPIDLAITLRPVVHEYWPEAPSDNHIMMFGQEAIFASARDKR